MNEDRTLSIDVAESRLAASQRDEDEAKVQREWREAEDLRLNRGGTEDDHDFEPGKDPNQCAHYGERRKPNGWEYVGYICRKGRAAREHRRWRINVYRLDQAYGGPEEGGWYVETGEPHLTIELPAGGYWEAAHLAEHLEGKYSDHRARYSVMPRETDYAVAVERHPAVGWPQKWPHYE